MKDNVIKLRKKILVTKNRLLKIIYVYRYRKLMRDYGCEIPLNIHITRYGEYNFSRNPTFSNPLPKNIVTNSSATIYSPITIGKVNITAS